MLALFHLWQASEEHEALSSSEATCDCFHQKQNDVINHVETQQPWLSVCDELVK